MQVVGYDVEGADEIDGEDIEGDIVGAGRPRSRVLRLPPRPGWRSHTVAPGVHAPHEGMQILPLATASGSGVFTNVTTSLTWQARPQRPFRGERLLIQLAHTNPADGVLVLGKLFIGTSPQMVEINDFNLANFGPQAFGVRFQMDAAAPGILIQLQAHCVPALAGFDTISVSIDIMGRSIG